MLGEAWWVVRLEKSSGKDLDSLLQTMKKQQVFASKQRMSFRNKSTKWWRRDAGSRLCLALCEFLSP